MYAIVNSPRVESIFKKMSKKDAGRLETIAKKLEDVAENPHRFKPLRSNMKGYRRLHFGSFVLVYSIDETRKTVMLEDYDHHDRIYRK